MEASAGGQGTAHLKFRWGQLPELFVQAGSKARAGGSATSADDIGEKEGPQVLMDSIGSFHNSFC